ncbi:MAG: hypothetical protein WEC59_00840 [Salibacteraceae bacterium]
MIKNSLLAGLMVLTMTSASAQKQKFPNFSFQAHSIAFANSNMFYEQGVSQTKTDTLPDNLMVHALSKIMETNPQISIDLIGHVSMNEDTLLALERATLIKEKLKEKGIKGDRIEVKSMANRNPLIADTVILELPTAIEKEAANAKNRRVEVHVNKVQPE